MKQTGPKGWHAGTTDHREQRFADAAAIPLTYDEGTRTVDAVLSKGSPVARIYGREVLSITAGSINLDRVHSGGVPLLDSHSQASINSSLGKVTDVWIERGALMGRLQFHQTRAGKAAEGQVRRGEIAAISIGYRVTSWRAEDDSGNSVDPEDARWDDDLTFTATRWELPTAPRASAASAAVSATSSTCAPGWALARACTPGSRCMTGRLA
jgi:hypothetical protein